VIAVTLDSNVYIFDLEFGATRLLALARAGIVRIDTSEAILSETIGVLRDNSGGRVTGCILPDWDC